jgi:hypothetical protein
MRNDFGSLVGVGACLVGFLVALFFIGRLFDTTAAAPAHAMELATVKAEAEAAKAETARVGVLLEKTKADLKASADDNDILRKRIAALEAKFASVKK